MASRKNLKKRIKYISELAAGACIIGFMGAENDQQKEEINKLLQQIVDSRKDMISRISHTEPGSVKLFYKKLKDDFKKQLEDAFYTMEKLGK